jgi:hypothetical protein
MRRAAAYSLSAFVLLSFSQSSNAASMLRIACDGQDVGAEVFLNGEFKGECPLDIQASPGTIQLRVSKPADDVKERVFTQEIRMGEGVVKRVDVVLGPPQFTVEGQKREDERLRLEARRAEEAAQREAALLAEQENGAEAGNVAAMLAMAERYETGRGVANNFDKAQALYKKAAEAGSRKAEAVLLLGGEFRKRFGDAFIDELVRLIGQPTDGNRQVDAQGKERIEALIASDPFFAIPDLRQSKTYYLYRTATLYSVRTCTNSGRLTRVKGEDWSKHSGFGSDSHDINETYVLGGLLNMRQEYEEMLFRTWVTEIVAIHNLYGQPFPLTEGRKFGITASSAAERANNGRSARWTLYCAVNSAIDDRPLSERRAGTKALLCYDLDQNDKLVTASRRYWDDSTCGFLPPGKNPWAR